VQTATLLLVLVLDGNDHVRDAALFIDGCLTDVLGCTLGNPVEPPVDEDELQ
jgi:hypothetical protein